MKLDYKALGFKAGLEIHQELDTGKLFCKCSTNFLEKNNVSQTQRKLRAVSGESGEVDLASAYEQIRDRSFNYKGYQNESCLVCLDEEPPHNINPLAFEIGLGVAKMFDLVVPDTVCVMRKSVTDGSATSGFQRTMILGLSSKNSILKTKQGNVHIDQLNLEEDSCKIEEKKGNIVHYSLSRLGIPLLEIGTDASLKNPSHVKETALQIGTLLRSFKVKRGIGSIRQDVNISIKEGARVEIKGWQDIKKVEELVDNEVIRQHNLVTIKKTLLDKGLKNFEKKEYDVTLFFKNTTSKIIQSTLKKKGIVHALVLPHFADLLKQEICPGKTFGRELSEYAKAYGTKGMIHTDEDLKKYELVNEFEQIKKELKTKESDLIIVISEQPSIVNNAIESLYQRALYCLKGVPEETRIPNHHNATSSYARPLPGANRLYPETDIPNIKITSKLLNNISIPELLPEKIKRFVKEYQVQESLAKELISTNFETYVKTYDLNAKFIAQALVEYPKEIKKRYKKEISIEDHLHLFDKVIQKKISKDALFEILSLIAQDKKINYSTFKPVDQKQLKKEVQSIIDNHKGLPFNALIGKVMGQLRGKADGKIIVELVKKLST